MEKLIIKEPLFHIISFIKDKTLNKKEIIIEDYYNFITVRDEEETTLLAISLTELGDGIGLYYITSEDYYDKNLKSKKELKKIKQDNGIILLKDVETNIQTLE